MFCSMAILSTQPEATKAPTANSDVMESEETEDVVVKNKEDLLQAESTVEL